MSAAELLSAIVDSSDDAIVSKDLNGVVMSWNKSAERIFGYTAEEMVGQPILAIIPQSRRDEEPKILERLRRGERVDHFDTVRVRKDGESVHVSLTISPVRNSEGVIIGASKVARDVTARKRAEDALQEHNKQLENANSAARHAREEAERQSRLKDEFLATLSHELRTPLQSILGWTQLLLDDGATEEDLKEGLQVIDRNARAQTRIIEDLLDMSRIISGKIRLDVQRCSLASLVEAALETVKPAAMAKEIRLQSILDPLAQPVRGDAARLQQVFWNLLSNAIKFTPRGGRVQIVLERVNSHLEVSVIDTGVGIEKDFLPHVFERFRQGDASKTRSQGGLGLGLAIVKSLIELHGGTVKVRSDGPGTGATFSVILPLAVLQQESEEPVKRPLDLPAPAPVAAKLPVLTGVTVLVVDDENDARDLISRMLAKAGATVGTAGSARAALELMAQTVPDVLLSDIGMPVDDGYALIRAVRQLPAKKGGKVPAIALSAYTRTEDRVAAISAGFQLYLAKPCDALELLTMIDSLVRRPEPLARDHQALLAQVRGPAE
ncbi:MAG TPA: PAS domain S-box protein [Prosthecobacter sp.]|nr:PAS domain S-box protein [Prosthecobacter sp.]